MNSNNFTEKSNINILFDSMIEVIEIMNSYNIISFLNYGALLGYVREKRLLPWNNDVELCVFLSNAFRENIVAIMLELEKKEYRVLYHEYAGTLSVKKDEVDININLLWRKNDLYIRPHDTAAKRSTSNLIAFTLYWSASYIFVYELENKKPKASSVINLLKTKYIRFFQKLSFPIRLRIYQNLINFSTFFGAKYLSTSIPYEFYSELKTVDFGGFNVRIPVKSEALLSYIYGSNWEIPKDNWSFYDNKNQNETSMKFIVNKVEVSDWKIIS